ncbi:sialidase family protein [Legionella saoudiensis]|uniref:sialidase family protein n=1 Tax=Legionella saoudiensis TaxID=1750561 RepID=UPI00072FE808|nr:sialidase family protein [Legionella saoudiensis]
MNKKYNLALSLIAMFISAQATAGANFTIGPKAGTTLPTTVPIGKSVPAYYTITNNTNSMRSGYTLKGLPATAIPNVSNGNCTFPLTLGPKASCVLQLDIIGAASGGFFLCKASSCTSASVPLNVSVVSITPFVAVGGYSSATTSNSLIATSIDNGAQWSYTLSGVTGPRLPSTLANEMSTFSGAPTLNAVDCVLNNCSAVGSYGNQPYPLIASSTDSGQTWNYTMSANTAAQQPAGLTRGNFLGVSCSGLSCVAAGGYSDNSNDYPAIAFRTNPTVNWSYASLPTPFRFGNSQGFSSVKCTTTACVAVGNYTLALFTLVYPLIMTSQNQGATWAITLDDNSDLPDDFHDQAALNAVDATGSNFIAVGSYTTFSYIYYPLVALSTDNGSTWTFPINSSTLVSDFYDNAVFYNASCSGEVCIAVGRYENNQNNYYPLIATSSDKGQTWTYTMDSSTPQLPSDYLSMNAFGEVYASSCSGSICVVGGDYQNENGDYPLLANSTDGGKTWTYRITSTYPTMTNDTMTGGYFNAVQCKGTTCFAAGSYSNGTKNYPLLAVSRDGGNTWSYSINGIYPILPSDYQDNGMFTGFGVPGVSKLLPDSLKILTH